MIRSSRTWRTTAVLGAAALALAACGGDDEPSTTDSSSASGEAATGDGELVLGTLLPQTGSLAFLGPPEFAGVQLAVDEINAAGGVNGKDVAKEDSDSGDTSTDIASQSVDRLLSQDVDAVIGAASSGVSFTVIDKITAAGVVHFSPANTSPDFTDYDDNGLYFRTAPSDVLQGRVMGELLVNDGFLDVGVLALDDPYGTGLAENIQVSLEAGGGSIAGGEAIIYDPKASSFSAEVTALKGTSPEAIVLVGFEETKKIVPELQAQGIGPDTVPLYFVDGNLADYSADFAAGTLENVKGTLPGAEATQEFKDALLAVDPSLKDYSYAPESYDATMLIALAAIAAGDDSGEAIGANLEAVSKEGEKCTEFKECADLLADGTDIDYDGKSGPVEFSDKGDPTEATIGVYQYGADNKFTNLEYVSGKL